MVIAASNPSLKATRKRISHAKRSQSVAIAMTYPVNAETAKILDRSAYCGTA